MDSLTGGKNTVYKVIGIMSGTSLDGMDIAFCHFEKNGDIWKYRIIKGQTIEYPAEWQRRLRTVEKGSAQELAQTDHDYGHLIGKLTKSFIDENDFHPEFIASHGHTVFHQPDKRLTLQIGHGAAIVSESGLPVICDFRSLDVALGGQGAPLVPIGDRLLFGEYDFCLNIGGIANISNENCGRRIAFDICPANMVLNTLANQAGKTCDENGGMARSGKPDTELLQKLNDLDYYEKNPPKSLGKEWVMTTFFPLIEQSAIPLENKLSTVSEHIAQHVSHAAGSFSKGKMLITGGGAFNTYLVERIRENCKVDIVIPDNDIVNFKEALIFAFLGVLRWRNEVNCLRSYTGASHDNSGGSVYLPPMIQ